MRQRKRCFRSLCLFSRPGLSKKSKLKNIECFFQSRRRLRCSSTSSSHLSPACLMDTWKLQATKTQSVMRQLSSSLSLSLSLSHPLMHAHTLSLSLSPQTSPSCEVQKHEATFLSSRYLSCRVLPCENFYSKTSKRCRLLHETKRAKYCMQPMRNLKCTININFHTTR